MAEIKDEGQVHSRESRVNAFLKTKSSKLTALCNEYILEPTVILFNFW